MLDLLTFLELMIINNIGNIIIKIYNFEIILESGFKTNCTP